MAHELERLANGQTAFASARLSAWHQLGTITEATMSAEEIMAKAFLGGWAVRKIPVFGVDIIDGVEHRIDCDDKRMTVRRNVVTGATEYLGIVGEDYGVVQNEQCAEILDRLVDQVGGAHFETAGSLRRGKSVFVTMKLPEAMQVAGVDDLDLYLVATTSHDGTASLRVDATPVRVVCANTQRAAFAHTKGTYVFRHTPNVNSQIAQAREAIGLMWKLHGPLPGRRRAHAQRRAHPGRTRIRGRAGVAPRRRGHGAGPQQRQAAHRRHPLPGP